MDTLLDMLDVHTIAVTKEVLALIAKLDEFKNAWQSFGAIVVRVRCNRTQLRLSKLVPFW